MKTKINIKQKKVSCCCADYVFRACVFGLFGATVISAGVLLSGGVFASSSYVENVSVGVPVSCSLVSTGNSYYQSTIITGQTGVIVGDPITVVCNDTSGYAVYAIGYSGDTYTGDYHTDLISTLSDGYNIKTDGTGGESYWKMKLGDFSNITVADGYDDFQNIPTDFTKVASYNTDIATSSFTPTYQVYIGANQPADKYTGKVKYVLVHPNDMVAGTYSINYDANGGSGTMSGVTGLYNFEEFTLPSGTFTAPSGYQFGGWCTTNSAGPYACDGDSYSAGDSLPASPSILATANGTLTLYAYYQRPYMQSFTLSDCQSNVGEGANPANIGDEIVVYDRRAESSNNNYGSEDDGSYTVRYINGQCWMTQNLRITGVISATDSNFSGSDFNVSEYNLDSNDSSYSGHCDATNGYNNACVRDSGYKATGAWYNYYAVSAGTVGTDNDDADATSDICPSGWHLPSSPNTVIGTDFNKLIGNTTSGWQYATDGLSAFRVVVGGAYVNGTRNATGSGYWWSATANNGSNRYYLYYYDDIMRFVNREDGDRSSGRFARCVRD